MKVLKKVSGFFERINREIRFISAKAMLIMAAVFAGLGILSWIIGGRVDRITIFFVFPRCAIRLPFMYAIWTVSFAFCGACLAGILCGCEKYKKNQAYKCALFLVLMQVFTYAAYPLFFGAVAPFISFISFLIAEMFCILCIFSCAKLYSLWTVCLTVHFLWLLYNGYATLAFALTN